MVQKSYCWLIALICIALTGCSSTPLRVYSMYEEELDTAVVCHNNTLYEYDKQTSQIGNVINTVDEVSLIQDLSTYGEEYSLVHKSLSQHEGTLRDAAAYSNFLQTNGFSVSQLTYKSNYLDITLDRDVEQIRVLYLGSDTVRIFYSNQNNKNYFPPYINKKGSE